MRYTVRDVAKIVGLSPRTVRSYAREGFLAPERGHLGEMRFSFQDLLVLQTAKGLMKARVPASKVRRALARLKAELPGGRSLTALRIVAAGKRIVVSDGKSLWDPETGQSLIDFDVADVARKVAPLARQQAEAARRRSEEMDARGWFDLGYELEPVDLDQARDAYRRAIELEPENVDAHVNLGRLLHEAGEIPAALAHYRIALVRRPGDTTAAFNLGVALADLGRLEEAVALYEQVIAADPGYADAYYNIAHVYEKLGKKAAALRNLNAYRKLTEKG